MMIGKFLFLSIACVFPLATATFDAFQTTPVMAQSSYELRRSVIGGGGGQGTNGLLQANGTLGQSTPLGQGLSVGKGLYPGFWGDTFHLNAVGVSVLCPPDLTIPGYSQVTRIGLVGFRIINTSATLSLAFEYVVASQGPGKLFDLGNPASLSGRTPALPPGGSFSPPPAAIDISPIRIYSRQITRYRAFVEGSPIADSCAMVMTFEPPIATLFKSFEATATELGVELKWDLATDGQDKGLRLYRRTQEDQLDELINSSSLIASEARSYTDIGVHGGTIYFYTLGVQLSDGREIRSATVQVKTPPTPLALRRNHPNPFNPNTTISFSVPQEMHVNLSIFNCDGKLVQTLVDGVVKEGLNEVTWDGRNARGERVGSGVYFYQLKAGKRSLADKMVLLK
jgi:hypothetical protein